MQKNKIKLLTKFLLCSFIMIIVACESGNYDVETTTSGEDNMQTIENLLTIESQESAQNHYVSFQAKINVEKLPAELQEQSSKINYAEIVFIGHREPSQPNEDYKTVFFRLFEGEKPTANISITKDFGEKEVVLNFYDGAGWNAETGELETGDLIAELKTTIEINIKTWYLQAGIDINHMRQDLLFQPTGSGLLGNTRGDHDLCWVYMMRIPKGGKVVLTHAIEKVAGYDANYGGAVLEVHYRLEDYRHRDSLYVPPDEAKYHIDAETDKWIEETITLTEGTHIIYVAPSVLCDLSKLTVFHEIEQAEPKNIEGIIPNSGWIAGWIASMVYNR